MKILIVSSYSESLLNFRGHLIKSLLELGADVHVAAPELKNDTSTYEKLISMGVTPHDVKLSRTGINPFIDLVTILHIFFLCFKIKPSHMFAYTVKPVIYGAIAAFFARVKNRSVLISGLGYAFQEGDSESYLKRIIRSLYRFSLSKVDVVFFQNPDDKNLFIDLDLLAPSKQKVIVVNGSGVDVDAFNVTPLPDQSSFLMIGRLLTDKGVREYIEACKIVKEKHANINFYLAGWIDDNPAAIDESELLEWTDNNIIQFLGKLEDVRPAISESTVFVLPSYREGTPRTVLEAMSMGRPVITTDAPGCRETVENGVNGFLIPVRNYESLAERMMVMIENSDLVSEMGKKSRQFAEEKYDVRKVTKSMLEGMGFYA